MSRIHLALKDHTVNQLQRFTFIASPGVERLFVLRASRLRTLHPSGVESWPASLAENLTHIRLGFDLNVEPGNLGEGFEEFPEAEEDYN